MTHQSVNVGVKEYASIDGRLQKCVFVKGGNYRVGDAIGLVQKTEEGDADSDYGYLITGRTIWVQVTHVIPDTHAGVATGYSCLSFIHL